MRRQSRAIGAPRRARSWCRRVVRAQWEGRSWPQLHPARRRQPSRARRRRSTHCEIRERPGESLDRARLIDDLVDEPCVGLGVGHGLRRCAIAPRKTVSGRRATVSPVSACGDLQIADAVGGREAVAVERRQHRACDENRSLHAEQPASERPLGQLDRCGRHSLSGRRPPGASRVGARPPRSCRAVS